MKAPSPRTVGVVGAGTMGSGIAQRIAMAGPRVVLVDVSPPLLEKARAAVERLLAEGQERRVLRPEEARATLERLAFTTSLADLKGADLVIEAIYEDEKAKRELFSRLDGSVGAEAVFATNTSSLSVAGLAGSTRRPERFIGMHFFFHPVKNRLVELIPIDGTDPSVFSAMLEFARSIGKTPIEAKDAPGFAVNRFFVPWLNEAVRMLEERTTDAATIDAAAREAFGIGMGPFALMNATGVPIACHAAEGLSRLGPFYAPAPLLKRQAEGGAPWPTEGAADASRLEAVAERLWGVVFWVAVGLVSEGVASREDVDRGARLGLRWARGPFEEMNRLGGEAATQRVRAVCRRHSLPFPAALDGRSGRPWRLTYVRLMKEDGVARIVLDRPETLNALDQSLATQLLDAVERAQADVGVRGLVIEARGKAFMAGADVKFFAEALKAEDLDAIVRFTRFGHQLLRRLETGLKPAVALIDGPALGGGLELALACRARVATPRALFRLPETSLGIYPGLGGTQRLPRLIGKELAKFYILSGAAITPSAAQGLGLVEAVLPPDEALARAKALAAGGSPSSPEGAAPDPSFAPIREAFADGRIADLLAGRRAKATDPALERSLAGLERKAPLALRAANELIDAGLGVGLEEGLALELSRIREIFSTADAREGIEALIERRAAVFKGA